MTNKPNWLRELNTAFAKHFPLGRAGDKKKLHIACVKVCNNIIQTCVKRIDELEQELKTLKKRKEPN